MALQLELHDKSEQTINSSGRIHINKVGWLIRLSIITGLIGVIVYNLSQGILLRDPLVAYSTIMPIHALLVIMIGWLFYKNPATGKAGNELVSVIVPVYNQESMIDIVIDAIYSSSYKNVEVIAVNDGSKDKTRQILDNLAKKYPTLNVIHKKNEGKRQAVATGFYKSKGNILVLIDSDSVIDKHAIKEFMKTFSNNPDVGSVVGYAKVWNAKKNFLTKCQDVWYDYAFNIHKTTESYLGNVMCCSGCLAGYRREAIERFIPYWLKSKIQNSDDRDLTTYVIANQWAKQELTPLSKKLMENCANYDDAEDRILTAQTLVEWKSVYVASAIVYTDVPEKIRGYIRQQTRWKKGYIRSNFFVSTFFWKKNPIISSIFYTEFMTTFTAPFITLVVFVYEPFILKNYIVPLAFVGGSLLVGLAHGLDYKFRDPKSKTWKYKPIMNLFTSFGLSWLIFPAILTLRKNQWLTR
ncbi:MAG: glycosyltransferase family 2 protein [Nitrosarchaeum sp.]|nr:glycosyltransferase family 2 protein [Nitrosarchaeum sp.]